MPRRAPARCLALAAAALWGVACGEPRRASPSDLQLRVLVYNIHAGTDAAGAESLQRVAALIREYRADLVLLQEVDRGTARSGGVDQLGELARRTGLHGVFRRTLPFQGGEYGLALLSRWPVLRDTMVPLPVTPPQARAGGAYEPRGVLHATVQSPWGTLHALNTHLDPSSDDYRLQEVETVIRLGEGLPAPGTHILLGGDFNAPPDSPVVARLTAGRWRDAWPECGTGPAFTYPAATPVKRIDYLFVTGAIGCDSAGVIRSSASDHRPVLFVLRAR